MARNISFNVPHMTGKELDHIRNANAYGKLAGDGPYTKNCQVFLEQCCNSGKVLLTHSCTAALEMQSLLLDIQPGDEVIMPSYTFVSTANAVALRGGKVVFVDIREDTLNIDENLIEAAITPRTRAIAPVHYAGVACEMDTILALAKNYGLLVLEDAAQGFLSYYKGCMLGSIGDLGAYSFHETKNIISGEGGALLVNNGDYARQAEIIREKGTDRSRFFRGEVDKYTWQDAGSSYLPGEVTAAFLWAQLEEKDEITANRLERWRIYHELLEEAENAGLLRRPVIPPYCRHNAHMYYVLVAPHIKRQDVLAGLKAAGVGAVFHYVPLHTAPAAQKFARISGTLAKTEDLAARLIRLPLYYGLTRDDQEYVVTVLNDILRQLA